MTNVDVDKAKNLVRTINKKLPGIIKLEYRGKYKQALFTDAKKRYALLGRAIEIKGFEAERGDWCPLARETQRKVIELVLKGNSKRALAFTRKVLSDIKKYPISKFVISKQISRPLHEYKVRSAHIEVAKTLASQGEEIEVGDTVQYVINISSGASKRHSDKAVPAQEAKKSQLDFDYYRKKQIIPVCLRILKVFRLKQSNLN